MSGLAVLSHSIVPSVLATSTTRMAEWRHPAASSELMARASFSRPLWLTIPAPVMAALAICGVTTLVFGVLPGLVARFGELRDLTGAFGR